VSLQEPMTRISGTFRMALAGKGLLLLALGLSFIALMLAGLFGPAHALAVRVFSAGFVLPAVFLGWTAGLAFADAVEGQALEVDGAVALRSRAAGFSLRLPDGHYAEFILFNPWQALVPERHYRVTIGRRSRVLVARPAPSLG
jgi:hypothetical protein